MVVQGRDGNFKLPHHAEHIIAAALIYGSKVNLDSTGATTSVTAGLQVAGSGTCLCTSSGCSSIQQIIEHIILLVALPVQGLITSGCRPLAPPRVQLYLLPSVHGISQQVTKILVTGIYSTRLDAILQSSANQGSIVTISLASRELTALLAVEPSALTGCTIDCWQP